VHRGRHLGRARGSVDRAVGSGDPAAGLLQLVKQTQSIKSPPRSAIATRHHDPVRERRDKPHRLFQSWARQVTARAVQVADLVHDLNAARLTPRIDRAALKIGRLKAAALHSITDDADADIGERGSAIQGGAPFVCRYLELLGLLRHLLFPSISALSSRESPKCIFVFTREELLRDVWGHAHCGRTRTLDSHASRLRRRLADAGADGLLRNIWGIGYRLMDPIE
jgi:hypothetical protein